MCPTRKAKKLNCRKDGDLSTAGVARAECHPLRFLRPSMTPMAEPRAGGGIYGSRVPILANVTRTVDRELLLRNEYLAAENRILKPS